MAESFNHAQALLDAIVGQRDQALGIAANLQADLAEARSRIADLEATVKRLTAQIAGA